MTDIVLASASPRRKEILEQIGLEFRIVTSNVREDIEYKNNPGQFVEKLALMKAQDVARKLSPGPLVIGADTIVLGDNGILGKPKDKSEAFTMLEMLSDKVHKVLTGIAIVDAAGKISLVSHEVTEVKFRAISGDEIEAYVNTGEPMDKAGGYGIQGKGALFVEKINGCYFNVVGLPVSKLFLMLRELGAATFILEKN